MADLSIQQQKQLNLYLQKHPNVSRKQAIQVLFTHSGGGGGMPPIKELLLRKVNLKLKQ